MAYQRAKSRNSASVLPHSHSEDASIASIPELSYFNNLRNLSLSTYCPTLENNKLTEMKSLASMETLVVLDLSFNQLTKIQGLKNLTRLEQLFMSKGAPN